MKPTEAQRQRYMAWAVYPPAREGGAHRMRTLPCFTCRGQASRGCVKHRHLVGDAPDVLPPLRLEVKR